MLIRSMQMVLEAEVLNNLLLFVCLFVFLFVIILLFLFRAFLSFFMHYLAGALACLLLVDPFAMTLSLPSPTQAYTVRMFCQGVPVKLSGATIFVHRLWFHMAHTIQESVFYKINFFKPVPFVFLMNFRIRHYIYAVDVPIRRGIRSGSIQGEEAEFSMSVL